MAKEISDRAKKIADIFKLDSNINVDKIDLEIYNRVMKHPDSYKEVFGDIKKILKNHRIKAKHFKKKCKSLAQHYMKKSLEWELIENWFCVFAYVITIITMVLSVINLSDGLIDGISAIIYLIVLVLGSNVYKYDILMSGKVCLYLRMFNRTAPSFIVLHSFFFYFVKTIYDYKCIAEPIWWPLIFIPFLGCLLLSYDKCKS